MDDYDIREEIVKDLEAAMSGMLGRGHKQMQQQIQTQKENNDSRQGIARAAACGTYRIDWRPLNNVPAGIATVADLEASRRSSAMDFKPLCRCPDSPLCVKCEWPQLRFRLLCMMQKRLDFPVGASKLVLAFARVHRVPTVVDLPPRSEIRIQWRDPCVPQQYLSAEEVEQEEARGRAGTAICEYYDPASLAMELYATSMYSVDNFQMLRGGLLSMVGECQLWWSAVTNFAAYGSCAPHRGNYRWGDTVPHLEFERMQNALLKKSEKMQSRSRFALLMCREDRSVVHSLPSCAYADLDELVVLDERVPPRWWTEVTAPWDRHFKILFDGQGEPASIGCYYFCVGGCGAPLDGPHRCQYMHDPTWGAHALACISIPRLCGFCGDFADELRCGRCKSRFYCSVDCQREEWKWHKPVCGR